VSTPSAGLSEREASARLAEFGPNRFVEAKRWSGAIEILRTLADPMALMLAAGSVIYFALGDTSDAIVLAVALVPVLGIDVLLETRSRKALSKLASAVAPRALVVRDGVEREIDTVAIVPGDLLVLREGAVIHADGLVVQASNLALDESQLTGESEPQHKESRDDDLGATIATPADAKLASSESLGGDERVASSAISDGALAELDSSHQFFAGSLVLSGHGLGRVTHTGRSTRFGDIVRLVGETEAQATPLQKKIGGMVRRLVLVAAAVVALVFALERARGTSWSTSLISAVSLAMSAAPEEFPLVFTLFLALGAWRLSRRGVLVRRLASVETLGSTSVICVDKTGTITHGRFELAHHEPIGTGASENALLEAAALACEPEAFDTLERAILAHCAEHGIDVGDLHRRWTLVHDYDFDPRGKHMSHVWRSRDGVERIAAKGALEGILEHCRSNPEDTVEHARAEAALASLAEQGIRVLAVAERRAPSGGFTGERASDERDLELVGLIGFRDPLRAEVPAAIAECRRAGIAIKLITGDHALTAFAIASAAGITEGGAGDVVLGSDIDAASSAALADRAARASVFARIRPEQKLAIVEALQAAGASVAMTGDGINDAPALRRADIGVSMGRGATEVARNAADLVLLENDFTALVDTVREGRAIYANIQRAFLFLIAFHIPVVGLALAAPLCGWPLVLLPVHIVWLELIVHPMSALLFENAPAPIDAMQKPPRRSDSPLLDRRSVARSVISGVLLTLAALALYVAHARADVPRARSLALIVVIAGNLALAFAERTIDAAGRMTEIPRGARFWIVWFMVAASLPVCMEIAPLARLLEIARPSLVDWAAAIGAALVCVGWRWLPFRSGEARSPRTSITTDPSSRRRSP
jgi:Ca2+-transporting ATPase